MTFQVKAVLQVEILFQMMITKPNKWNKLKVTIKQEQLAD